MSVMNSEPMSPETPRLFPNTRWSMVLAARESSPKAAAALEEICRIYWYPLYLYVRRSGHQPHDAQDLTQEFFCRLLEKRWLDTADREKGKLRTFLIMALKHFMAKEWRRATAQRRGGGQAPLPMDTTFAESRLAADPSSLPPEAAFDRQWALTLLDQTIRRLQQEFAVAGRAEVFATLKNALLSAGHHDFDHAAAGQKLGMSEGAVRVAIHRLRKRFREIYREEISQTLAEGADLEAELRHLAAALARPA
jgi:RNA polymerase sigma factor (sigma-70 family)